MNDDAFGELKSRLKGVEPDTLTDPQKHELITVLKSTLPDAQGFPWGRLVKVVVSLAILLVFARAMLAPPEWFGTGTSWMITMSGAAVVGWVLAFFMWEGRQGLQDNTGLGVWLWGGIMVLIALNFGAVVIFASQCMDLGSTSDGVFEVTEAPCNAPDRQAILRFFLAAKEFGTVLAVALGFVSIAWVNFFTRQS